MASEETTLTIIYDFKDVDSLKQFLEFYIDNKGKTPNFIHKILHHAPDSKLIMNNTKIVVYNTIVNAQKAAFYNNDWSYTFEADTALETLIDTTLNLLYQFTVSELKEIFDNCSELLYDFMDIIGKYIKINSSWANIVFNHLVNNSNQLINSKIDKITPNILQSEEEMPDIDYNSILYNSCTQLLTMLLCFEFYFDDLNMCLFNYKGYKVFLHNITSYSILSNILKAITDIEEEIKAFYQSNSYNNDKRIKLFNDINRDVGAFFADRQRIDYTSILTNPYDILNNDN